MAEPYNVNEMEYELIFTPGEANESTLPLGRFLPPVPARMVMGWLKKTAAPGSLILDPLGSTPQLPLEAARAGYRVLVATNNPIITFMIEELAQVPSRGDFQAALAELASAHRGNERLEVHIRSLYQSECVTCHQSIQPQAFLWKRGETQPYARLYHCPHCGDEREHPLDEADIKRLALPGNPNLHRARALERIAPPGDLLRDGAQEAIQFFLPRSLYVLTHLINRIEGLSIPENRRRLLYALALSVCDDATVLWPYPEGRSRPRQLTIPPQFRENNLWLAIERAVDDWLHPGSRVSLTHWPELPPADGGICLFPGRLRSLLPLPASLPIEAATMVLPRPNQAFWTLSAVWSGWLWGRQAVQPLRNALERQRYDWHWHAQALSSVFSLLAKHLPQATPIWGILPELAPGFLSAAVLAAEAIGLHLEGLSQQPETELAQLLLKSEQARNPQPLGEEIDPVIERGVFDLLSSAGEPVEYISLHAAGLKSLAAQHLLPSGQVYLTGETFARLQNGFTRLFKFNRRLKRYERQPSQNIETGWWWFSDLPGSLESPLADRVEIALVRWLLKNPGRTLLEIEAGLNEQFPGLLTPPLALLQVCLDSYAAKAGANSNGWQVRPSEAPATRRADLEAIRRGLERLGKRLGFLTQGEQPLAWQRKEGNPVLLLFPLASAVISRHVYQQQALPPNRCILVIPGSRVNLALYKMRRDPRLAEAVASGWRFMKFRQLRQMLDHPNLDQSLFEEMLAADPPRWEDATQLSLMS